MEPLLTLHGLQSADVEHGTSEHGDVVTTSAHMRTFAAGLEYHQLARLNAAKARKVFPTLPKYVFWVLVWTGVALGGQRGRMS